MNMPRPLMYLLCAVVTACAATCFAADNPARPNILYSP